jgi:hypothetical protein
MIQQNPYGQYGSCSRTRTPKEPADNLSIYMKLSVVISKKNGAPNVFAVLSTKQNTLSVAEP